MNLAKIRRATRTPWAMPALIILAIATFPASGADNQEEAPVPKLGPKPYWIGATASHIAEPMTLDAIATELARFFVLVRNRYPGIKIGLTPNLPNWDYSKEQPGYNGHNTDLSGHTYVNLLERIEKALAAAGEHLDFIEVDCPFNYYRETHTRKGDVLVDNARKLQDLQAWCSQRNIAFVLIVNAEHRGGGGQAFHDLTVEYVRTLRRDGIFPDGFLIQSWYDKPGQNLPETEAGTFTNTVRDAGRLIEELFPRPASD